MVERGWKAATRLSLGILLALALLPGSSSAAGLPVRIGLTPTVPHDQYQVIEEWRRYMERKLGRPVEFVRRESYIETIDLLRLQKLDFAWICEYPYIFFGNQLRLLVVPLYRGRPYYEAYLIVPASAPPVDSIAQLRGKIFAYTDPYSNSGYLIPRYELHQLAENPATFFRKTFFTWSHRKAVEAVASGMAQGASVSSHVWDTLAAVKPELTAATRVVAKSGPYGFPPLVARSNVNNDDFRQMQNVLLAMSRDADGKALLRELNLDGFVTGDQQLYGRVADMMRTLGER